MPQRLDRVDTAILKALMDDGRRSYRQIAKITGVSTPTVESRIRRLNETGFIIKIIPRFDPDKVAEGLTALITFRVNDTDLQNIAAKLSELDDIRSIFLITGETNLMIRIVLADVKDLQDFISYRIKEFGDLQMVSNQIITKTIKDEQGIVIRSDMGISLTCDYCKADISGKPITLRVGQGERYFCCKTCRGSYKEKYRSRIESLTRKT
tara:strand:- start:246 stop:872 length:627 start_codon:yes stop_codon:yes gene_type:complete